MAPRFEASASARPITPPARNGFDGLVRITPDGILHIHTGVGNLGTFSYASTSRVAAEVLGYEWERCVIERGGTLKSIPWNLGQFGSNTSFTMTRTNWVAAEDAKAKLIQIAAGELGGAVEDYDIDAEHVVSKSDPAKRLSFADCAKKAIELGGAYDGHETPEDINPMTQAAVAAIAGTGLIGVAKDNLPKEGTVPALSASFIEIELDLETGKYEILDYIGVADCGKVMHPMGLAAQVSGGAVMGFGLATTERHIYDPAYGRPCARGLYQAKAQEHLGCAGGDGLGCGRRGRSAKPDRRKGDRRAARGLGVLGADLRDLRCAWWASVQPCSCRHRHDHQRRSRAAAILPPARGQHRIGRGDEPCQM